ncbi:MAG: hypothetical protein CL843_03865 [Crocinitomicaceae bacterium]|nr:hypothetical protein [Crocinitomicaceae bacterium]
MKVFQIIAVFTVLLFSSCGGGDERPKPENLIQKEQMIDILKEMEVVEARYQRRMFEPKSQLKELALEHYTGIFKKHGVTLENFRTSYKYYEEDPELLTEIFEEVIVELTKEQAEAQANLKEAYKNGKEEQGADTTATDTVSKKSELNVLRPGQLKQK